MRKVSQYLVVDAGNTRIKTGLFHQDKLVEVHSFTTLQWNELKAYLLHKHHDFSLLSSVRSKKDTLWLLQLLRNPKQFKQLNTLPVKIEYETPETLGADRLANAMGARALSSNTNLIIDLGTCIKFDLVDASGTYLGGSISPGLKMRYQALNHFTAGLPLIEDYTIAELIGTSTHESIHTGVMLGIECEIEALIKRYQTRFQDLTIFVTGGDAVYFDFPTKNGIFVNENLTLIGLYNALQQNVKI